MITLAAVLAATPSPSPSPTPVPTGGEGVKSGPIGLAVILVLCVMSYFLFKSMSKHLRKVREEFPTDDEQSRPRRGSYRPQVHREFGRPEKSDPPPSPPDAGP